MPLEQTVTVVNNSGKLISTGKQLVSIFNKAKGAYQEKKAELRSPGSVRRSQTLDPAHSIASRHDGDSAFKRRYDPNEDLYYGRRHSYHVYSEAGSRASRRSRLPSHSSVHALTENNLQALSEVSSTAPSQLPPGAYRSPYAETLPLDVALSHLEVSYAQPRRGGDADSLMVPRRRSEPQIGGGKDIDMDLAYGNIPPDLADRIDLDPSRAAEYEQLRAQRLIRKVEGLLDEAHCLQHSATAIIKHLQAKPDAAAEVALTLADLSSAVAKMSPLLVGLLKGGSPAVFALLASPQFLIGTGIAVSVTAVMFGGWKIVKKVREVQESREVMALEGVPDDRPTPLRTQSDHGPSVDEALVVDEELSTIETWRRGIMPQGVDDESADLELITPEADRATRRDKLDKDDMDLKSRRSARTHQSSSSHRTHRSSSHRVGSKETGQEHRTDKRSTDSRSSRRSDKSKRESLPKATEDGSSSNGDMFRARPRYGDNMLKAIFKGKKDKEASSSKARPGPRINLRSNRG